MVDLLFQVHSVNLRWIRELEPRSPDFQSHAFLILLKSAWKVPWAPKGINLLWETEQPRARKKLIDLDGVSGPLIALWNSPPKDYEFILRSSGREFLPMERLSPPIITNAASSSKRKRLINISNSKKEVLWSCYFHYCFQFIFYFAIISRKQPLLTTFYIEDEHINVTLSGRLSTPS